VGLTHDLKSVSKNFQWTHYSVFTIMGYETGTTTKIPVFVGARYKYVKIQNTSIETLNTRDIAM
jgi:hypothetical protein